MSTELELPEIQGMVTSGFAHLDHARFFFLQIVDRKLAQAWLAGLQPHVNTSARRPKGAPKPPVFVQIAFTALGLVALGVKTDLDNPHGFPREFLLGMAHGERPQVLGDTGPSAPDRWEVGGPKTEDVHVLLMLYAGSLAKLDAVMHDHLADAAANGLKKIYTQESFRKSVMEPFGFRDGISQPSIEGVPTSHSPGQEIIKAGEFLLGYDNGYGQQAPVPIVPNEQDPNNVLPATEGGKAFGRNGTFLVLRKLAQDVKGFWKFMEDQSHNPDGTVDEAKKEWLAAKFVGRWKSGAPLTLAPEKDDPALGADPKRNNDFKFMPTDAEGFGCPTGSHIRRSNPRDMQQPNPERSIVITNRHRILRRGRPYQDGNEEGLLFIAINADIQRQFEFIQQTWINNEKFNGLYDNKDPLTGNQDDPETGAGSMTIQRCPVRQRITGIPRFIEVRGGGYFFLPSVSALKFLASLA